MTDTANCPKCKGKGRISIYAGIAGGVCFRCNGSSKISARSAQATRQAAQRKQAANQRRTAGLAEKEAAAQAKYGDTYRLAKALARFNHPAAVQASTPLTDMRDGKPDSIIEAGLKALPAVMREFGVTGLSIEEIEAEAEASNS